MLHSGFDHRERARLERIEMGLHSGFRADLTAKRARLEYGYLESPETADLLRRAAAGPQMESQPTPERGPVKQAFDDVIGLGRRRRARGRHRRGAGAAELVDRPCGAGSHGSVRAGRHQGRPAGRAGRTHSRGRRVIVVRELLELLADPLSVYFGGKGASALTAALNEKAARLEIVEFETLAAHERLELAKQGVDAAVMARRAGARTSAWG